MDFKVSIALHIIGIVMWFSGLLAVGRFLSLFCEPGSNREALARLMKRVFHGYALGGMVVALLSGLYQLVTRGISYYFSQGWFHMKITMVMVLLVVTGIMALDLSRVQSGGLVSKSKVSALHGIVGLILLLIVFATILGRAG